MSLFFKPKYYLKIHDKAIVCFLYINKTYPVICCVDVYTISLSSSGNNFIALHSSPFCFLFFFCILYFKNGKYIQKKNLLPIPFYYFFLRYNTQLNTIDHGIIKHFHGKFIYRKLYPISWTITSRYPIGHTIFRFILFFIFFFDSEIWLP